MARFMFMGSTCAFQGLFGTVFPDFHPTSNIPSSLTQVGTLVAQGTMVPYLAKSGYIHFNRFL